MTNKDESKIVELLKEHGIFFVEIDFKNGLQNEYVKGSVKQILEVVNKFNNTLNSTEDDRQTRSVS